MSFESDQARPFAHAVRVSNLSRQDPRPSSRIDRERRSMIVMTAIDLNAHTHDSITVQHWLGDTRAFENFNSIVLRAAQQNLVHHRAAQTKRSSPAKPFARNCDLMSLARVKNSFAK